MRNKLLSPLDLDNEFDEIGDIDEDEDEDEPIDEPDEDEDEEDDIDMGEEEGF